MPPENQDLEAKQEPRQLWSRFTSALWWGNVWLTLVCFAPECILAATLWTLTGIVVVFGSWKGTQIFAGGVVTLQDLLGSAAILLGVAAVAITLVVWSLVLWLVKVTAYTRSFITLPVNDGVLERSVIKASQKQALADIAARKAFLAKFWLFISLSLVFPLLVTSGLSSLKVATTSQLTGTPLLTLPPLVTAMLMPAASLVMVVISAVSLVAVTVAATTNLKPMPAFLRVLSLSYRRCGPLLVLTIAVLIIDVVIGSPQVLLRLGDPDSMISVTRNVTELLIEDTWQGVSSIVLWTFTMAPICELMRNELE
jgi:hypothetical protein